MIFRLDIRFFLNNEAKIIDLLSLFRATAHRGHSLFVVHDPCGTSIAEPEEFHQWLGKFPSPLKEEAKTLVEMLGRISPNSITRGNKTIAILAQSNKDQGPSSHSKIDLKSALRLATLPLFILVENGLSEAAFLRTVMPKNWQEKFKEWEAFGFVQFENGGGIGEIQRIIDHIAGEKSRDPLGLGSIAWGISHFFLCDRDSKADGTHSIAAEKLKNACERFKLKDRLHILERRDQESYLPPEALEAIISTKTGEAEKTQMRALIAKHLTSRHTKEHEKLPAIGDTSWFKNAFLVADIAWDRNWFEKDGSHQEMNNLAELIASHI